MVVDDQAWREQAACRGEQPELFFPVGTSGPALRQIEQAKEICRSCPVIAQCLAAALANGEDAGIWGGTTPEERRLMRRSPAQRLSGLDALRRAVADRTDGAEVEPDEEITDLQVGASRPPVVSRTGLPRRAGPVRLPRPARSVRTARRA